jgi:hypothetical protein
VTKFCSFCRVSDSPPTSITISLPTTGVTRNRLVTNFLLNSSAYVYTAQSTSRLPSPNFISKLLGNLQHTFDCSYQRSINFTTISSGQQGLLSIREKELSYPNYKKYMIRRSMAIGPACTYGLPSLNDLRRRQANTLLHLYQHLALVPQHQFRQ